MRDSSSLPHNPTKLSKTHIDKEYKGLVFQDPVLNKSNTRHRLSLGTASNSALPHSRHCLTLLQQVAANVVNTVVLQICCPVLSESAVKL